MEDDCYLPWNTREIPDVTKEASITASVGDPEVLRNGIDRPVGESDNGWEAPLNSWVEYKFNKPREINEIRLIFDSNLNRKFHNMPCRYPLDDEPFTVPDSMIRVFRIETLDENDNWQEIIKEENNYQRLVNLNTSFKAKAVRFIPEKTWGSNKAHVFAFEVK